MHDMELLDVEEYGKGAIPTSQSSQVFISKDENNLFSRLLYIFRNYLSVFGVVLILSYLLSIHLCVLKEDVGRAYIMSSLLIGFGVPSLLVHFITSRYMVVGNLQVGYLFSVLLLLQSELKCPGDGDVYSMGPENRVKQRTSRFTEIQGTLICVSAIHTLIGLTVYKWISILKPVILAPTLIVAGLMLAKMVATHLATGGCYLLFITTLAVIMGLYYAADRKSLDCKYGSRRCIGKLHLAVVGCGLAWGACAILSSFGVSSGNVSARTDVFTGIFEYIDDYMISYPFRWGFPIFSLKSIAVVCPAILVSAFQAVADCYKRCYASEDAKGAFVKSIYDRIILEGACTLLSSLVGINVGISVDVKSDRYGLSKSGKVIDSFGCLLLILIAFSGTLCALFSVIPQPILVALTFVAVGSLVVEGVGMVTFIEFDRRNIYIMGISIFLGILIPELAEEGNKTAFLRYFLSTGAIITAISSILLDFILPGKKPNEKNNLKPTTIIRKNTSSRNENNSSNSKSATAVDICECLSSFFA